MLPTSWRRITITGRFVGLDGVPIVGKLLFDSPQVVEIDGTLIVPRRITVALNADGEIPDETSIPSTHDPDLSVTGWAYTVTEDWVGGRKPYRMFIPYDATSIDIPTSAHAVLPQELIDNRGPRGYSAYEVAVQQGFVGTADEWLESNGIPGENGLSAYEIAVENGFSGSVNAWLASLRGLPGTVGENGLSAYEVALQNGFEGTEEQWLVSLKGDKGDDGQDATGSGSSAPRVQVVNSTSGGSFICDWSLYDVIRLTLTEAAVTIMFNGAVDGQVCRLKLTQDASGNRIAAMPPEIRFNSTLPVYAPNRTANFSDLLQFQFDEAEGAYDIFSLMQNIPGPSEILEISTGITWSQSTVFAGLAATSTNMRDENSSGSGFSTGAGTNFSVSPEYVQADLGSPKAVSRVTLGGGNLPGWGGIAFYLNGSEIQYSTSGAPSSWTTVANVTGITDTGTLDKDFEFPAVVARYWRVARASGYIAVATFKLYG